MSCNLGNTGTRFTVNSQLFCIIFWFLVEHFKLSARTKDARDTRDAFLESVYPCILFHGNDDRYKNFIFRFRYIFPSSLTVQSFIAVNWQKEKLSTVKIFKCLVSDHLNG